MTKELFRLMREHRLTTAVTAGFACLALLSAFGYYAMRTTNNTGPVVNAPLLEPALSAPDRRKIFKNWQIDQLTTSSATEASPLLRFKLKFPRSLLAGKLLGIFIDKATSATDRSAWIYFVDPSNETTTNVDPWDTINVLAKPNAAQPDFGAHLAQMAQDKRNGILKSDTIPSLVEINGNSGEGGEPGYNSIGANREPRPGVVTWWENGVQYTIFGRPGPNGTNLETLLEIARSMQ